MRKASKRSRRQNTDRSATTDIMSQVECAVRHPQATAIGAVIGGVVPWFARTLAHHEVPAAWTRGSYGLALAMLGVVVGCALFSALTVYKFGRAAFGDSRKALGFTLALEGVMLVSSGATSAAALGVLILINALANGSVIALSREATCKQRAAAAKSAATRARRSETAKPAPAATPAPARAHAPARKRPTASTALAKAPRWNPAMADDVIDAEIVSEELYS
ncbi:MAG TPA: hypothetical protein VLE97_05745 [Gaiellaceae bacterium]|nr:hypothetical protein [Gaiellaceae bacterium]